MKVKTRFAPSPTGSLHIGGVRTALFSWLYAQHHKGKYVLRIEDTDRERSTQKSVDGILESLAWLGIESDEEVVYQSQRDKAYAAAIDKLFKKGLAYVCTCSAETLAEKRELQLSRGEKPRYDRTCRDANHARNTKEAHVVRFRNPLDGVVEFDDEVRGSICVSNEELDDLVIQRGDGSPTYNFCVVVDDAEMNITHVIRGDDHINNTPRQINLYEALEYRTPVFAHVPMILGSDGQRFSKRHGAASVLEYRNMGVLPEALLNYLVRLGWSHGDQEIFSREEMITLFDVANVNSAAAKFSFDKLDWYNQQYMRQLSPDALTQRYREALEHAHIDMGYELDLSAIAEAHKDRVHNFSDLVEKTRYLFESIDDYDVEACEKYVNTDIHEPIRAIRHSLEQLEGWEQGELNDIIHKVVEASGMKFPLVAQPIRIALTGNTISPSIDVTLSLLGKERTLRRLEQFQRFIDTYD